MAIFTVRQMQENFRVKGKKLYFGFVDLEKAFDSAPREVIRWAMRKLGVEGWLVLAVMSMYTRAKTVMKTVYGNSSGFEVKVCMHQGSALSPLLGLLHFAVSRRRCKMYCGHARLCVCLSVCPRPYAHITARTRM